MIISRCALVLIVIKYCKDGIIETIEKHVSY